MKWILGYFSATKSQVNTSITDGIDYIFDPTFLSLRSIPNNISSIWLRIWDSWIPFTQRNKQSRDCFNLDANNVA